jgi:hypothetical protein
MKISVRYNQSNSPLLAVCGADYADGCRLRLKFSDGSRRTVDFKPFLENAQHPAIRKYLDPNWFQKFSVENGDLHWNHYDLSFPIDELYRGTIRL